MQTSNNSNFGSPAHAIQSAGFGSTDPNNPYGAGSMSMQPPPKKSNAWLWILLGVSGVLVVGCCGCGGLAMWGTSAGLGMVADQIKPSLTADPVVQEHVGEIKEMNWNLMATGEANEKKTGGGDVMVWDVKGSKGNGQIRGELDQSAGTAKLKNGKLKMSDGTEFDLTP